MPQDQDENFKRLTRIAKFLVPTFILLGVIVFSWFELSNQVLNIEVVNKNLEWSPACSAANCSGVPTFYIVTPEESFITTEAIYNRIEIGAKYDVETEGFTDSPVHRRIDFLF
ncbi:hypothetical protein [Shewanella violacea]|uniref:Uncharacterized protein n=1 Tax=Shewanella violacea (strain JCM 10179 / CIP 106290 / LMG 19151 / DSS12) TaxID=637905 RepID=D4ZEB6_SHEVD|nr:hypothetical protein [Shewanella violacea]BAJ04177.1 hypothetical protein SVI_4206 [Shewanella violacea DSS12]